MHNLLFYGPLGLLGRCERGVTVRDRFSEDIVAGQASVRYYVA